MEESWIVKHEEDETKEISKRVKDRFAYLSISPQASDGKAGSTTMLLTVKSLRSPILHILLNYFHSHHWVQAPGTPRQLADEQHADEE